VNNISLFLTKFAGENRILDKTAMPEEASARRKQSDRLRIIGMLLD
jgi:hypothetical protein